MFSHSTTLLTVQITIHRTWTESDFDIFSSPRWWNNVELLLGRRLHRVALSNHQSPSSPREDKLRSVVQSYPSSKTSKSEGWSPTAPPWTYKSLWFDSEWHSPTAQTELMGFLPDQGFLGIVSPWLRERNASIHTGTQIKINPAECNPTAAASRDWNPRNASCCWEEKNSMTNKPEIAGDKLNGLVNLGKSSKPGCFNHQL